jgi:hypothetical protein
MKKLTFIVTVFIVLVHINLLAQIKVNSSGYVGINNTNPTYRLDVSGPVRLVNSTKTIIFDGSSIAPTTTGVDCGSGSYPWENLWVTKGYFTYAPIVISDLNYKTNIVNLMGMNDKLKLLRPVSYELRTDISGLTIDKNRNKTQLGFIAQELQEVFPSMVVTQDNGLLGIGYSELIPVLVQALKEQQEEIEKLNERILSLEKTAK